MQKPQAPYWKTLRNATATDTPRGRPGQMLRRVPSRTPAPPQPGQLATAASGAPMNLGSGRILVYVRKSGIKWMGGSTK
jgi:hypothetical protein